MRRRCPEVERRKVWMPASCRRASAQHAGQSRHRVEAAGALDVEAALAAVFRRRPQRSEEHTSELQSLMRISYAVFCLKKKNKHTNQDIYKLKKMSQQENK